MIKEDIKNLDFSEKKLRNFGLLFVVISLVVGIFILKNYFVLAIVLFAFSISLSGISFKKSTILYHPYKTWMTIAVILGFIMSTLILSVVFFVVVTPISIIARIFGKKFLDTNFLDVSKKSFWLDRRDETLNLNKYIKQF